MATHVIIVVMGSLLMLVILQIRLKYKRLYGGEMVIGTVSGFEMVTKKNNTIQVPVIDFTTKSNVKVCQRTDDSILPSRIKKGTNVKVFYHPANPLDFLAQGLQFKVTTMVVLIASAIFALFGFVLVLNDLKVIHLFK